MSEEVATRNFAVVPPAGPAKGPVYAILFTLGTCHLLIDIIAGLVPGVYPMLKSAYGLTFSQIGVITLTNQLTSSMVQPLIGYYTDKHPRPYYLAMGMLCSLFGILFLAYAHDYPSIVISATIVGLGSAVFHPESSRVARLASGGQHGLAQSIFQVGGNFGFALGPLLAAFVVLRRGQSSIAWFAIDALVTMGLLWGVGRWYKKRVAARAKAKAVAPVASPLPRVKVIWTMAILLILIFSKYIYLSSFTTYFTFYLISKFHVSIQNAQVHLFLFLGSTVTGILIGGPLGDRIGRRYIIWFSILGVLPFTLALPHVNLLWTGILTVVIAMILSSAFSAILVYAQELVPGNVGMIAGLFFGFAFGIAGIGAAVMGKIADRTSIFFVYQLCAFLPAAGILAFLLPDIDSKKHRSSKDIYGEQGGAHVEDQLPINEPQV